MIDPAPPPHTHRALHTTIDRFIRLRRWEQMSLHQALNGLRISDLPWLQPAPRAAAPAAAAAPAPADTSAAAQGPPHEAEQQTPAGVGGRGGSGGRGPVPRSLHAAQRRWLAQWVWFVMAQLVVPLLRSCFYCTESEPYRQQVFFYR